MKRFWRESFLERIVDRKRDRLRRRFPSDRRSGIADWCRALMSGEGDASSIALSGAILFAYSEMNREDRRAFFELLGREFDAESSDVRTAAEAYLESGSAKSLRRLARVVEPRRQELFRRLNMAPHGAAAIVAMRGDLLASCGENDGLRAVDADLKHLLGSWFNPGFLSLERIDWDSPASLLEMLIRHDTVQVIDGWDDLRRRLCRDRRCFAFFHPALPGTPLVFVEVALVRGMAREPRVLLDKDAPAIDPRAADTAMFYSINATQRGLRGLSFGNFLINRVLETLQSELPTLEVFATLSPLTGFAGAVKAAARNEHANFARAHLEALLADFREQLRQASGIDRPADALFKLLADPVHAPREVLAEPLKRLALVYFSLIARGRSNIDPVANFHLSNGACLAQINPFADTSPARFEDSYGVMVNYRYAPGELAVNREKFAAAGEIAMSAPLSRAFQKLGQTWTVSSAAA